MPLSLIEFSPHHEVERKVNFFADFFNHYNSYLGRFSYLEFENISSLCDKAIFQLKFNPEKCKPYIKEYFAHRMFQENGYTTRFRNFSKVRNELALFIGSNDSCEKYKSENPKLLKTLNSLSKELKNSQLNEAMNFVISYLRCTCPLEKHEDDFCYLIQIIISELRFTSKSKKEIGSLIRSLMSKKEGRFPLPRSITQYSGEENYSTIVSDFFTNRNFRDQFLGVVNFNEEESEKGYYLLRIQNLKLPETEVISFGGIKVMNPKNPLLSKFELEGYRLEMWEEFTTSDDSILVIEGDISNVDDGKKKAIEESKTIIRYINSTLDHNCQVYIYRCLITKNFKYLGFSNSFDNTQSVIDKHDLAKLKNDNSYSILSNNKSKAAIQFLYAERYYQKAKDTKEISDYWLYLEAIIPKKLDRKVNGEYKFQPQIKDTCTNILTDYYLLKIRGHIAESIFNFVSPPLEYERTDYSLAIKERRQLTKNFLPSAVLKKTKRFRKYPIINYLHKAYKESFNQSRIEAEQKYYKYFFNQFYGHRNSIVHGGNKNFFTEFSQKQIIERYIKIIRLYFLEEVKQSKRASMLDVVRRINKSCKSRISGKLN